MSVDKQRLQNICISLQIPYQYKQFNIKPISVIDFPIWENDLDILTIEKNYFGDIEIIQMSHLKFLFVLGQQDEVIFQKLYRILHAVIDLNWDQYEIDFVLDIDSLGIYFIPKDSQDLQPYLITPEDFTDIRTIILYQNIYGYDDRYVDPDLKKAVEEYQRLKNKSVPHVPLERKIAALIANTNLTITDIQQMSIRLFYLTFDTMVQRIDYQILKQAECAGAKFQQPIEHWIYYEEKDKYAEGLVDYDTVEQKINSL